MARGWVVGRQRVLWGLLCVTVALVGLDYYWYEWAPLGLFYRTYYLSGGQPGGAYHAFACDVSETLGEGYTASARARIVVEPSGGTVQNFIRLTRNRAGMVSAGRYEPAEDDDKRVKPCATDTPATGNPDVGYADLAFLQDTPSLTVRAAKRLLKKPKYAQKVSTIPISEDDLSIERINSLALVDRGYLQIIVRTADGPKSIAGLRGRKVFIGAWGSGVRGVAEQVCLQYGLAVRNKNEDPDYYEPKYKFEVVGNEWSFSEAAFNLRSKPQLVDAVFFLLPLGAGAVTSLADGGKFALLDIERAKQICAFEPELDMRTIPAGAYPGSDQFPAREIRTVSVRDILACRADFQSCTAYKMVDAIFADPDNSLGVHAVAGLRSEDDKVRPVPHLFIPLHEGARWYYEGHRYDEWMTIPVLLAVFAVFSRLLISLYRQIQRARVTDVDERLIKLYDDLSRSREASRDGTISQADFREFTAAINGERRRLAERLNHGQIGDRIYSAATQSVDAFSQTLEAFARKESPAGTVFAAGEAGRRGGAKVRRKGFEQDDAEEDIAGGIDSGAD